MAIRDARRIMERLDSSLLVERENGSSILIGLLSARDLPFLPSDDESRTVREVMTPIDRLITAAPDVSLDEAETILHSHRIEKLPLVDNSNRISGLITKRDIILHRQHPHVTKDGKGRLVVGAAVGIRGDYLDRSEALVDAGVDALVVDVAHAHSEAMGKAMERLRSIAAGAQLICGNIATAEGARFLMDLGADGIKVGIGPGRGCRTRIETGAGVPQLQAIREVWRAIGDEVPIIADGGVRADKDIFLALACGASTVMLGSAFAGTDEAPGTLLSDPATGRRVKIYRGMTSPQAVWSAYDDGDDEAVADALGTPAEGQEVQIPYLGSAVDVLGRIRGHLRSAVSYAGASALREARARIVSDPRRYLIPLTAASIRESFHR
jgi:IMP dehydrogenase